MMKRVQILLPGWGLEFVLFIVSCISSLVLGFTALISWDIFGLYRSWQLHITELESGYNGKVQCKENTEIKRYIQSLQF